MTYLGTAVTTEGIVIVTDSMRSLTGGARKTDKYPKIFRGGDGFLVAAAGDCDAIHGLVSRVQDKDFPSVTEAAEYVVHTATRWKRPYGSYPTVVLAGVGDDDTLESYLVDTARFRSAANLPHGMPLTEVGEWAIDAEYEEYAKEPFYEGDNTDGKEIRFDNMHEALPLLYQSGIKAARSRHANRDFQWGFVSRKTGSLTRLMPTSALLVDEFDIERGGVQLRKAREVANILSYEVFFDFFGETPSTSPAKRIQQFETMNGVYHAFSGVLDSHYHLKRDRKNLEELYAEGHGRWSVKKLELIDHLIARREQLVGMFARGIMDQNLPKLVKARRAYHGMLKVCEREFLE